MTWQQITERRDIVAEMIAAEKHNVKEGRRSRSSFSESSLDYLEREIHSLETIILKLKSTKTNAQKRWFRTRRGQADRSET